MLNFWVAGYVYRSIGGHSHSWILGLLNILMSLISNFSQTVSILRFKSVENLFIVGRRTEELWFVFRLGQEIFASSKRPDRIWNPSLPPATYLVESVGCFRGAGIWSRSGILILSTSRMCGAIPPLPHTASWCWEEWRLSASISDNSVADEMNSRVKFERCARRRIVRPEINSKPLCPVTELHNFA
jgi:hypothetical protein